MKKGSVEFDWQVPKIRKNLKLEKIECKYCGTKVEIWSDEKRAKCRNCEKYVYRE